MKVGDIVWFEHQEEKEGIFSGKILSESRCSLTFGIGSGVIYKIAVDDGSIIHRDQNDCQMTRQQAINLAIGWRQYKTDCYKKDRDYFRCKSGWDVTINKWQQEITMFQSC